MFRNYLKTALRSLQHNRVYTFVNIAGLSFGIAICIILFLIIRFELSFDRFHTKESRIYRVLSQFKEPIGLTYGSGVPFPLPHALRQELPQLEKVAAIYSVNNTQFQIGETAAKKFKEEDGVYYTEPFFFDIFDFTWLSGTPATALSQPNSIVITRDVAQKYFGNWGAAIGQIIKHGNNELKITGILENVPPNTDFQFKYIISYSTLKSGNLQDWNTINSNLMCYVLLPANVQSASINNLLPTILKKYKRAENAHVGQFLQPLHEVHFDTQTSNFLKRTVSQKLISVLEFIGAFILVIACVNFINLSTAQSINRAKEVGVRKVLGSNRLQLQIQFYCETATIVLSSIWVSLGLVHFTLPFVSELLQLPLSLNLDKRELYLFLLILCIAVVFLAGFYPALMLSGFNVVAALKSRLILKSTKGIGLRKALVIVQFVIAQVLIIGTIVIVKQMRYFHNTSMGFTKEAIVKVPFPADSVSLAKLDAVKASLLANPSIKNVSFSFGSPAEKGSWQSEFTFAGNTKPTEFAANLKWADADYVQAYDLKLIAGRNYRKGDTAKEVVISEELVKRLGLTMPEAVLNKELSFWEGQLKVTVVGVIKDFHSQSLHEPISPVIIGNKKNAYRVANIRLEPNNIQQGIKHIESLWSSSFPESVFDYRFMDKAIESFYKQEQQLSHLYQLLAVIAIFLSCLGLYGLVSFMAVQRRKEVGIRKVLGATTQNILALFSKEFILLLAIAFMVATPIAFYLMKNWLQDFAYRTPLAWWLFAIGGLLTLTIALVTIGFQAIKAAFSNPTKNLRIE